MNPQQDNSVELKLLFFIYDCFLISVVVRLVGAVLGDTDVGGLLI